MFTRHNLEDFGATFERYWKLTNKSRGEALAHTGKNFTFFLFRRLKAEASPKGAITNERLSAIRAGDGLKISDRAKDLAYKRLGVSQSVTGKRLQQNKGKGKKNVWNEVVAQELRLRESHRMFTASSARFKGKSFGKTRTFSQLNGKPLGAAKGDEDSFVFDWGTQVGRWSGMAAAGLTSASRRQVLDPALRETEADMLKYITRKQTEAARNAARIMRRV